MKRRFRASIYLDVWIDSDKDLEDAREEAMQQVRRVITHAEDRPEYSAPGCVNLYVGGVARYTPENLLKPLDRDI
jgi:hypothetical protein